MSPGAPGDATSPTKQHNLLEQILSSVQSIQMGYQHLSATVESIQRQVDVLSGVKQVHDIAGKTYPSQKRLVPAQPSTIGKQRVVSDTEPSLNAEAASLELGIAGSTEARNDEENLFGRKHNATATSRIILTTYPGQSGIDPVMINWGLVDALERGPVVVSRSQSTVRRRNGKRG